MIKGSWTMCVFACVVCVSGQTQVFVWWQSRWNTTADICC